MKRGALMVTAVGRIEEFERMVVSQEAIDADSCLGELSKMWIDDAVYTNPELTIRLTWLYWHFLEEKDWRLDRQDQYGQNLSNLITAALDFHPDDPRVQFVVGYLCGIADWLMEPYLSEQVVNELHESATKRATQLAPFESLYREVVSHMTTGDSKEVTKYFNNVQEVENPLRYFPLVEKYFREVYQR